MYDIRQFKSALYFLLLVGMSGFALAAEWPGVWVLAVGGILLNAWLVKTNRFTPMPRFLASIVTIIAFVYIADLVLHSATTPILIIGQFLVLLQLVKLYEQRANRDYAQLIILSLLLMVAAAINTASLLFGLLFIAYLFLSLYVCLLFHLKVESEDARKAITLPEIEINPNTLRQDQRYLSRSMRRLTGLIAACAVVTAIFVFLFFPRNTGANILGPLQFKPSRALTGFSEQVGFQQVARITQNNELVAHVKLFHNDKPVSGTEPLLLRGLTLDYYNGAGSESRWNRAPYQWTRLLQQGEDIPETQERLAEFPPGADTWKQQVTLRPTGTSVIFAIEGAMSLKLARKSGYRFSRWDQTLQASEASQQPFDYEVVSTNSMRYIAYPKERMRGFGIRGGGGGGAPYPTTAPVPIPTSRIDPKIAEYARLPEVSGVGAGNVPLVTLREQFLAQLPKPPPDETVSEGWRQNLPTTPFDSQIETNIEKHLRTTFTYTLDLTDAKRIEGQDPMVAFLYDLKRGHCEYFAGAMTLMLQSLNIPSRMVIGFRCDDYNNVGGYYRVEQSQAHAWVEARGGKLDDPIWVTYDPTSGREDQRQRVATLWTRVRHVFDYLEHSWATNVIAYDRGTRDNLVQTLENRLTSTAVSGSQQLSTMDWNSWLKSENWAISSQLLFVMIVLAMLALVIAVAWYAVERYRMWRRAARIGVDTLPSEERLRLVRQLGFYDDLLRLLERRGMTRPSHLTPMEFTDSLAFLPAEAYHAIRRITEVFYRIRFGRQQLSPKQRDRLDGVIRNVESVLGPSQPTS